MGMDRLARLVKYGCFQMKKALITGINGQDGSYLSEHLLDLGYQVYGMVRRQSVSENQTYRIKNLSHRLKIF